MNFPEHLFPAPWPVAAWVPLLAVWVWSGWCAPWKRLRASDQLNVMAGMVVVLALLWSMKAGVRPGLNYHLLGATVFVLAFGPHLATIGLTVVLAAVTLNGGAAWSSLALNALVMVVIPVWVAYVIYMIVDTYLPNHLFVYIFVNAFLGGALAVLAAGIGATLLLLGAHVYDAQYLTGEYLPYYLLLAFSEAWISGMAITLMVVYRPAWIGTFDDARYLLNK